MNILVLSINDRNKDLNKDYVLTSGFSHNKRMFYIKYFMFLQCIKNKNSKNATKKMGKHNSN